MGSSVPWKGAQRSVYVGMKLVLMCCTSCTSANIENMVLGRAGETKMTACGTTRKPQRLKSAHCVNSERAAARATRSISLTPVWMKTMERFSYSSTHRNTQLMLVKLAVTAGCPVLSSNRSEQPNLMSLFLRLMNQRKPTSV